MKTFPWHATELFLHVCDAGGITAASRFGKIGLSQPAISSQMMQLETELGTQLFERKPFKLTTEGKRFQEEALRIRADMNRLRGVAEGSSQPPLRIAASDVIIRDHLPPIIKSLDASTRTRIVLREAPSEELAGMVNDEQVDLAIGLLSRHVDTGTKPLVEKLAKLPMVLNVPPAYAETITQWRDFKRLLRDERPLPWIGLSRNNLITQHLVRALQRLGISWQPTMEISSLSHMRHYVDLDFGFGISLHTLDKPAKGQRIPIPGNQIPALELGVWHRNTMDPAARHLLALIRNYVKSEIV